MSRTRFSAEEIARAIEEADSTLAEAARIVGCSIPTIRKHIQGSERVRAAWERTMARREAADGSGAAGGNARRKPRYSPARVAAAIEEAHGNLEAAARALGCKRRMVGEYARIYPRVGEAYRRSREAAAAARRPARHQYALGRMTDAIREARGLLSVAARLVPCPRGVVLAYVRRYPEVAAAYEEARAGMVDRVENKLAEAVDAGKLEAVMLVLRSMGGDRGYTTGPRPAGPSADDERPAGPARRGKPEEAMGRAEGEEEDEVDG